MQQTVGRAAGKAAAGVAKKASGGLLKKILIGFAVIAGISTVYTAIDEIQHGSGGNGNDGGGTVVISNNNNSGRSDNGGSGNSTVTNGSGVTVTAEGVTLSIEKSVYNPGETITVQYSGVSAGLVSDGAWLGIAGYLNDAAEFEGQEFLTKGSGTVTMKAPNAPGQYQVRFFKGSSATVANLAARLDFGVHDSSIPDPDFDVFMQERLDKLATYDGGAYVSVHGVNVTFDFQELNYERYLSPTGARIDDPFDEDANISGNTYNSIHRDAFKLTGTITDKRIGTDPYGDKYYRYEGRLGSFETFTCHSYLKDSDRPAVTDDTCVYDASVTNSNFVLYVYENGHRQVRIDLRGTMTRKLQTQYSNGETHSNTVTETSSILYEDFFENGDFIYTQVLDPSTGLTIGDG